MPVSRRVVLMGCGSTLVRGLGTGSVAQAGVVSPPTSQLHEWARHGRILLIEGYNAPFYPVFDYHPERAIEIALSLGCDAIRFPAAGYFAHYPTATRYPRHPGLGERDPMAETLGLCRQAGLRFVAYVPLNHPFVAVADAHAFSDDLKRFADKRVMTTRHYGYGEYAETCLLSPWRRETETMVAEILRAYAIDAMYFDGPYQGMDHNDDFCHCRHCRAAYQAARGKSIPRQDGKDRRDDILDYLDWLFVDVAEAALRRLKVQVAKCRDVPVLYNNTPLLRRRNLRSKSYRPVEGFMFEAAETAEQKLFNMQVGLSTGKLVWSYVGYHTPYNREHLRDGSVRGWYSHPVDGDEILLDGAVAVAAGVGLVYWGMNRFDRASTAPLRHPGAADVRQVMDFARAYRALAGGLRGRPQTGVLVGAQTLDWFEDEHFIAGAYENGYHGAWRLLKDLSFEPEPLLDFELSPARLRNLQLLFVSNAVCLNEAQCQMVRDYVRRGGLLVATHQTSLADERGRMRANFGLADVFGVDAEASDIEEIPDLYLHRASDGRVFAQDPQIGSVRAHRTAEVLAVSEDHGRRRRLGPAIVHNRFGRGQSLFLVGRLEAVYAETGMRETRELFEALLTPWLGERRPYLVPPRPGVTPHLVAGPDALCLHIFANVGDKTKKKRHRESFVPVRDVEIAVRVPDGARVVSARRLRAGGELPFSIKGAYATATLDEVLIHEAVLFALRRR